MAKIVINVSDDSCPVRFSTVLLQVARACDDWLVTPDSKFEGSFQIRVECDEKTLNHFSE